MPWSELNLELSQIFCQAFTQQNIFRALPLPLLSLHKFKEILKHQNRCDKQGFGLQNRSSTGSQHQGTLVKERFHHNLLLWEHLDCLLRWQGLSTLSVVFHFLHILGQGHARVSYPIMRSLGRRTVKHDLCKLFRCSKRAEWCLSCSYISRCSLPSFPLLWLSACLLVKCVSLNISLFKILLKEQSLWCLIYIQ